MRVVLTVNGEEHELDVEPRRLLADVLRHELGCYGVHLGCEHGVCGACTVRLDGATVRSCLLFAAQLDGQCVDTIEAPDSTSATLAAARRAFAEEHGLQCGFCTPAFVLAAGELLERQPDPDEEDIRSELAGNICRCTGYVHIVRAVRRAADALRDGGGADGG